MASKLQLPRESAKFISLQRLETQALGNKIHYTKLGNFAYKIYEKTPLAKNLFRYYSLNVEPKLRSRKIIEDYSEIMSREFEQPELTLNQSSAIPPCLGRILEASGVALAIDKQESFQCE